MRRRVTESGRRSDQDFSAVVRAGLDPFAFGGAHDVLSWPRAAELQ